ncbi:ORF42-like protein [Bufonid herpesvirus 1]|uniref:ORF42-like protein n=1 Tax=Bufonid herpesvirus 1 TaxID=2282206 RepID=UPI000EB673E0|nr:ORF42-like protein [Bufonid herpesvirus 1]AXF48608.1 ORF42-like protein [Bufonid herpesvirus 1]
MSVENLCSASHMAHCYLCLKHIAAVKTLFPYTFQNAPIVLVVERNTYSTDVELLMQNVWASVAILYGKTVHVYMDRDGRTPGFITTRESKVKSVSNLNVCLAKDLLGRLDATFSFGSGLYKTFLNRETEFKQKIQIEYDPSQFNPLKSVANPTTADELYELSDTDKAIFFKTYGGVDISLTVTPQDYVDGWTNLEQLCKKLSVVSLVPGSNNNPVVSTGGKKWVKGQQGRDRDDIVSAFLIGIWCAIAEREHKPRWQPGKNLFLR